MRAIVYRRLRLGRHGPTQTPDPSSPHGRDFAGVSEFLTRWGLEEPGMPADPVAMDSCSSPLHFGWDIPCPSSSAPVLFHHRLALRARIGWDGQLPRLRPPPRHAPRVTSWPVAAGRGGGGRLSPARRARTCPRRARRTRRHRARPGGQPDGHAASRPWPAAATDRRRRRPRGTGRAAWRAFTTHRPPEASPALPSIRSARRAPLPGLPVTRPQAPDRPRQVQLPGLRLRHHPVEIPPRG